MSRNPCIPRKNSTHTSCLSMCMLWHVEFLNEQECVHKRLSSPLHLGNLHDVFVQMISLACRQPNYLSSSDSSEPKRTSTRAHIHRVYTHTTGLSECCPPPCVMEAITLLLSVGDVGYGKTRPAPRRSSFESSLFHNFPPKPGQ